MQTPINALNSSHNFLIKLIFVYVTEGQSDEDMNSDCRYCGILRRNRWVETWAWEDTKDKKNSFDMGDTGSRNGWIPSGELFR